MRRIGRASSIAAAGFSVALLGVSPAWTCSVVEGYVRPTNYELVQLAETIVVAKALRQIESDRSYWVEFRIEQVLKGTAPATYVKGGAIIGETSGSDPSDISASHPEGHNGPCNRDTFAEGKQYVLFLVRDAEGEYHQLEFPFSRVNEDYLGEDSLWTRTTRTYIDVQRLGWKEQLEALEALLEARLNGSRTPTALAEARDILDHLRSRSPWKPTAYLVDTYEALERGEQPKYTVRSHAADRENSAAQDFTDALRGVPPPSERISIEDAKELILNSLVDGNHPDAAPLCSIA